MILKIFFFRSIHLTYIHVHAWKHADIIARNKDDSERTRQIALTYSSKKQRLEHMPPISTSHKIYEMKISGAYFRLASREYIKMKIDVQYWNKYD